MTTTSTPEPAGTDAGIGRVLPFAITLATASSLENKTGAWRVERPVYRDFLPPCNDACPAGENIQKWLYDAEDGSYEQAWRTLMRDNPLPAVMGRVCYHPCQTACNRGRVDEAVGINAVERFLGDEALRQGWAPEPCAPDTGKHVLIVGAGPAGLSAAYQLRRRGHAVTVRDAAPKAGGMMRYGIPAYRLPRDVLDAEIARIEAMGVRFVLDSKVDHIAPELASGEFDAVFLAVGAQIGRRAYIPAGETARILDAVTMLKDVAGGGESGEGAVDDQLMLGRRVVVYGGGNTALDAARTAKRLGAEEAIIVYRRTRERMPAHDSEVVEALEEGIQMRWLSTVQHADAGKLRIERMELDETGFPQPTGEFEDLAADSLILALGQESDLGLVDGVEGITIEDGVVQVDDQLMTGYPGLFAGGDMVPSQRTVTVGIGHGKKAARAIDAYLRGEVYQPPERHRLAQIGAINSWYYSDAPQQVRERLEGARRSQTFAEVVRGLSADDALFEARRCMSCGNCFECDNCFGVCPDNAVIKLEPGKRYAFNYDYCKGCGICAEECPCGAIEMVPEMS
ncbi:NAD(P)-binding protein [Actinomyces ruminicola]|uniref:2-oxoacid:acceptor oxidoreductase, delta subunit, pyruvate/2-ketoisovalerate family n=1 Tax=Actinomyces ruminicola TaxID=332524 RepID=A0A1G9UAW9_9ACTO|nr:NAD(P)-binding protein [Actinomyces ruminicola]SDM56864.1 2-oxoacid:acceptor oxidoreductase, delta subunit, pyruvate/2-ketoisovalerate family [Actinomyces ruminicola]